MPSQKATIVFGALQITYGLRRSDRRKTVNIAVDPREGVLVTAPRDVDADHVHRIVARKARWIANRLRDLRENYGNAYDREFVSGESFPYLGRNYRLKIIPGAKAGMLLRLLRGRFEVRVDPRLSVTQRSTVIRVELRRWYQEHAAERIPERVGILAPRLGMISSQILIRDQQKRWASCDHRGQLRFNWRIIMAPMSLVDYVVAHELRHLIRHDHSPTFWKLLCTVMPDYAERRERLRREGWRFWF
ncbi:MAG: M48 family metallopeptidase [Candidatus Entotheonellia bacterium]